jgi:hypothetical protein
MLPAPLRLAAEEHINQLAERHRIYVRRSRTWDTSEADAGTSMVQIPAKIRTGTDYMAALHEIGHLVDPTAREHEMRFSRSKGKRNTDTETLLVEAAAWAWAARNARPMILKALTKADRRRIGMCWVSWLGPVW